MASRIGNLWAWWRAWNQKNGFAVQTFCVVAVLIVAGALFYNTREDSLREQKFRAEQTALLKCFDQYANANAPALSARSAASARRDEVLAIRDQRVQEWRAALDGINISDKGLGGLIRRAQKGIKADPKKTLNDLAQVFSDYAEAKRQLGYADHALEMANAALNQAREDNPLPPPPSQFCDLPTKE